MKLNRPFLRLGMWLIGETQAQADRVILWEETGRIEPYDTQREIMLREWERIVAEEKAQRIAQ